MGMYLTAMSVGICLAINRLSSYPEQGRNSQQIVHICGLNSMTLCMFVKGMSLDMVEL